MMNLSLGDIIKIIESEPEYTGEPTPELLKVFNEIIENKDTDRLVHLLRSSVNLTKRCIRGRILKAAKDTVDREETKQNDNI